MHHRLRTGKMQFTAPYPCPYYNQICDQSSNHGHFLTCKKSTENKEKGIEKLEEIMEKLNTPTSIIKIILKNVSTCYKILTTNNIELFAQIVSEETNLRTKQQNEIGCGQFIRGRISKNL